MSNLKCQMSTNSPFMSAVASMADRTSTCALTMNTITHLIEGRIQSRDCLRSLNSTIIELREHL
ncbi:hypothetical protein BD289DRAFT_421741, partial [Coniella lustricola]